MLAWSSGWPDRAWNVRLADGRRVKAVQGWLFGKLWRRTADQPPAKYQWGKVEIGDADVVFTDVPTPQYEPPVTEGKPNLAMDLARDAAFVSDLADVRFAIATWQILYQGDCVRLDGEENGEYLGRDGVAWLIAGLRGLGEDAPDFKFWEVSQTEWGVFAPKIEAHLRRLGWRSCFGA